MTVKTWETVEGTKRRRTQRVEERMCEEEFMEKSFEAYVEGNIQLNVDSDESG